MVRFSRVIKTEKKKKDKRNKKEKKPKKNLLINEIKRKRKQNDIKDLSEMYDSEDTSDYDEDDYDEDDLDSDDDIDEDDEDDDDLINKKNKKLKKDKVLEKSLDSNLINDNLRIDIMKRDYVDICSQIHLISKSLNCSTQEKNKISNLVYYYIKYFLYSCCIKQKPIFDWLDEFKDKIHIY